MERLRLWWWRMRLVRCECGQHRLARGTGMELAGVNHHTDGPCYPCDVYGRPL